MSEGFLLGRLAYLKNYITSEQLVEALELQKQLRKKGTPRDLDEILEKNLGYLDSAQVEKLRRLLKNEKYRTLGKKYLLIRQLGQGAMGVVFLAKNRHNQELVAVKILPPSLAKNQRFIERFKREATATEDLEHKHLLRSYGLKRSSGFYYFAMEYIDGCTLREYILKNKPVPERDALDIVAQITKALIYADRRGLVHRDIKPDNIMLTKDGVAKLCDLGLAKFLESDLSLTQTGRAVGTPHYLSPEQARGEEDIDIRSDIYGLGVNLYLMVTGKLPFNGPTAPIVLKKHIMDKPIPPRRLNPNISPEVEKLILKMMAKRREDRFQKPSDLLAAIRRILDGENGHTPAQLSPPTTGTLPALKSSGRKTVVLARRGAPARKKKSKEGEAKTMIYVPQTSFSSTKVLIFLVIIGVLVFLNIILLLVVF
ncbi:MAG: serine/threonine protein kinase [Planctomycetota bacterium]|nr:MAG: serine/threonine protein kinase [Planctomycetota bacterium]